jgi:hypothetical protein
VLDAVVSVQEDAPDEKRLVAYVLPKDRDVLVASDLRHYLQNKLPAYMVPTAFLPVDRIPLTPNGKVDRRALAAAETASPQHSDGHIAPRTPLEQLLAGSTGPLAVEIGLTKGLVGRHTGYSRGTPIPRKELDSGRATGEI